ncbi:MAG: glycosyltransferase family 4 protein [Chlamydiae bacterium]|nr:glycosyltransferase family 4 protein [Chlamydiota bacterium]MBI3278186.1 glycosyltransferase family 4 protein [Chlamydiota bacterium]
MPAKISMDVQPLLGSKSGVGYYIWGLIHGLAKIDHENTYQLSFFDFRNQGFKVPRPGTQFYQKRSRLPGRMIQYLWKTCAWPNYNTFFGGCDLYHFPNFVIQPLKGVKKVVTIHDLSFFRYPEYTDPKNLKYLRNKIGDTVYGADEIIVDSHFTKSELLSFFKIEKERIHVIHLGIDSRFQKGTALREKQILFVGTLEPRKNIEGLLSAFKIFLDRTHWMDYRLTLVGMKGWLYEGMMKALENHPYREKIECLNYVSEEDLPLLYQKAALFIYPSFYEGFGLPPLEALSSGTPVIAARRASLPEVLGDAALWIDPQNAEAIAIAIERMIREEGLKSELIRKGEEQVKKFSWEKAARETLQVYQKALAQK